MDKLTITFIGAGNIARSLIGGLIADGYDPTCIWATNPTAAKLQKLEANFGIHTTQDNSEGASYADVLVFAVKPNILAQVAQEVAEVVGEKQPLIISVVTGITVACIQKCLGDQHAVVRCVPNTPVLLRSGATGLYASETVSANQKDFAESLLRAVGTILWFTQESQMDIVTALSGTGPAYFLLIMEALQQGAEKLGLAAEDARLLILQTAQGAAKMALESENDVIELRRHITSPGGTTEQAMRVLEAGNIRELFFAALSAAHKRAVELSKLFEEE